MRSNIARTESAGSVPDRAATAGLLRFFGVARARVHDAARASPALERVQEVDERGLLVLGHAGERRHVRSRLRQRAPDRAGLQLGADFAQVRARPGVAVLADLVADQAAGLGGDELAG